MNILVLCTGNSCRSQMMHGYLAHYAPKTFNIYSAGIETHGVNPKAIHVMKEDGIDISHHTSNHIDEYTNILFDHVITVCDNAAEACPVLPQKTVLVHYNFTDPAKAIGTAKEKLALFRAVRDEIKVFAKLYVSIVSQTIVNS